MRGMRNIPNERQLNVVLAHAIELASQAHEYAVQVATSYPIDEQQASAIKSAWTHLCFDLDFDNWPHDIECTPALRYVGIYNDPFACTFYLPALSPDDAVWVIMSFMKHLVDSPEGAYVLCRGVYRTER